MNSRIVNAKEFLQLLKDSGGRVDGKSLLVRGVVWIKGEDGQYEHIDLSNINFSDQLYIEKQNKLITIALQSVNVLGGLNLEYLSGKHVSYSDSETKWVDFLECKFESVHLSGIDCKGNLDLSGLTLDRLHIKQVAFEKLQLHSESTEYRAKINSVHTDDMLIARQFELARIPVYMSTAGLRKMQITDGRLQQAS